MKKGIFGKLLAALGMAILVFTAALAFANRNAPVRLTQPPEEARECTQFLADAVNAGDLAAVGQLIYGQPTLEAQPELENAFYDAIWQKYLSSLQWSYESDCQATDSSLCREATVTSLDIATLLPLVQERYETLFPVLAEKKGPEAVYNEDHSYRQDFVMEVLLESLRQVLRKPMPQLTRNVTVHLVYREAQWWIQPDSALMDIFSGSYDSQEA